MNDVSPADHALSATGSKAEHGKRHVGRAGRRGAPERSTLRRMPPHYLSGENSR